MLGRVFRGPGAAAPSAVSRLNSHDDVCAAIRPIRIAGETPLAVRTLRGIPAWFHPACNKIPPTRGIGRPGASFNLCREHSATALLRLITGEGSHANADSIQVIKNCCRPSSSSRRRPDASLPSISRKFGNTRQTTTHQTQQRGVQGHVEDHAKRRDRTMF